MRVRRVVTGQEADGRSVFVTDEAVEPVTVQLMPGAAFHQLWGADTLPSLPTDGARPPGPRYFPPPGGFRFAFFTLPPDGAGGDLAGVDIGAAIAELGEKLPGLADVMEPDHPGMHTTDTIDMEVVLSGEITLELDDGAEVTLAPGDTVVQNGTRHAWHNRGSEPATLAVFIVGAQRS